MTRRNIYRKLASAQRILRFVDPDNESSNWVRVEKNRIYYKPQFLEKYCHDSVVTDEILRTHINDLIHIAKNSVVR